MTTLVYQHQQFAAHETPVGHPEQSARYAHVEAALSAESLENVSFASAPVADRLQVERAHNADFVDKVFSLGRDTKQLVDVDPDTTMGPSSLEAALRGVGASCAAVDAVVGGGAQNAFVAARPPGHHAVRDRAMGFCVFNSVAAAALHARAVHGLQRVAVVDFDVHHGNGTQDILERDPDAFFASSHEWPQYPGSGREDETGAVGNAHNATLSTGADGYDFQRVWGNTLLPALDAFAPDIVLISAGFDAHAADPLGGLHLVEDDFVWVTNEILKVAAGRCHGRVVSVLEGGYDLNALASSVTAHVKTLASSA